MHIFNFAHFGKLAKFLAFQGFHEFLEEVLVLPRLVKWLCREKKSLNNVKLSLKKWGPVAVQCASWVCDFLNWLIYCGCVACPSSKLRRKMMHVKIIGGSHIFGSQKQYFLQFFIFSSQFRFLQVLATCFVVFDVPRASLSAPCASLRVRRWQRAHSTGVMLVLWVKPVFIL